MKHARILFLTGSLNLGGTERNILHLAARLPQEGFSVEVWSDYEGEPLQTALRERGIFCAALKGRPSTGKNFFIRLFRHNLPYQWRLFRVLRRNRGSIVHAFGFPMAYYAVILGRLAGCRKIIFSVQDWDVWKKSWTYRFLDRLCSRLAASVVADGEGARRLAINKQGMAEERIITIYDGVNVVELRPTRTRAEVLRELRLDPERLTVGMIARLDIKKKAQDVFIDAIPHVRAENPDAQFLIVGDGPDRAEVERRIENISGKLQRDVARTISPRDGDSRVDNPRHNDADVRATGIVMAGARGDLAEVLAALDILVIPSRWESVPKVLLEGMWAGKAVVATRVGDICEALDETCGALVDPDSPCDLAKAIIRLAENAPLRRQLGEAAHDRIVQRGLTLNDSIRQYEQLYGGLCRQEA